MQLIALKTQVVILSKHANPGNLKLSIEVGEKTIHSSISMKYLGLSMNCNRSFQSQTKTMLRSMATPLRNLHQKRRNFPSITRLVLFKALVLSQLQNHILFFTGLSKRLINSLDRQIDWGIKTAFFARKNYKGHLTWKHKSDPVI